MFDKNLFDRIIDLEISFDELEEFCSGIDKKEFDIDNPFSKYYSCALIIKAINKYLNKEITDRYLAYWCNAYDWILCGGFKHDYLEGREFNNFIEKWAFEELSWALDGLSFFDEKYYEPGELSYEGFQTFDRILKTSNDWNLIITKGQEYDMNEYYSAVLVNNKAKEFFLTTLDDKYDYPYSDDKVEMGFDEFKHEVNVLINDNYSNIGFMNIDEVD